MYRNTLSQLNYIPIFDTRHLVNLTVLNWKISQQQKLNTFSVFKGLKGKNV
jgi:hypothetical protein